MIEAVTNEENFRKFYSSLEEPKIILIAGKRRSGKTCLGFKFLETIQRIRDLDAYTVGFPLKIEGIKNVDLVSKLPSDCVAFMDEASLLNIGYSSRRSMKTRNIILGDILGLASQKGISLIFVVQNTGLLELNVIRQADCLAIKEPSRFQIMTERRFLKDYFKYAKRVFSGLDEGERVKHAILIDDYYTGLIKFTPPAFWSEEISYAFKNVNLK